MLNNKLKNVNMLGLQETVVNEAAHLYFTQLDKLTLTDFPLKTLKTYVPKMTGETLVLIIELFLIGMTLQLSLTFSLLVQKRNIMIGHTLFLTIKTC